MTLGARTLLRRIASDPRAKALACAWVGLFCVPFAEAGGLYANELSTTSQANAGAGRGAWAPDASAAIHNPASMTRLDDHGFATGASLAFGKVRFDPEASSPSGTGSGGNQLDPAPLGSLSYVHRVSDRIRFGLSVFSMAGSALDPSNDWAGRREMTEISLLTISIAPTVAVRLTDWLSIGGGPVASYGVLNWDIGVDPPGGAGGQQNLRLDGLDDWQPSGRVGLLWHPRNDFSLSVFYNSKTDFKLSGNVDGPLGLVPQLDTDLPLPQFVEVSAYWQATDRIALLATFGWEDWSEANELEVTLPGRTISAATGFRDTYKVAVGASYLVAEGWLLQTGLAYDTSGLSNRDRTTALPIDEQIRFAIGVQHEVSDSLTLGLSFVYVNLGQGEVRNPTVRGDYDRNDVFLLGMTLAFEGLPWSAGRGPEAP
jgi:long-chain fatty acid transport protein